MATQDSGSKAVNMVIKALMVVAVAGVAIGIRATASNMAHDEEMKAADPVIKRIVAERAANVAREALAALDAEQKLKSAGLSTTQPATQPAAILTASDLVGTWNSSGNCNAGRLSLVFNSVDVYHEDGTWTSVAKATWTAAKPFFDTETSITIVSNPAGTWKIEGDSIVQTLTSHDPRPADDIEAAKLKACPRLAKILLSHETDSKEIRTRIVSATPTTITLLDENKAMSLTTTMKRLSAGKVETAAATR